MFKQLLNQYEKSVNENIVVVKAIVLGHTDVWMHIKSSLRFGGKYLHWWFIWWWQHEANCVDYFSVP